MSKKQEIVQSLADLAKTMLILKERQEAIEQKLIYPSFEKGGHINNKDGEFIPPLNDPSKTAIPVTIEDLKKMAVCFHEWAYRPVDDKEADEQTSENLEKKMRYFLKKYLS